MKGIINKSSYKQRKNRADPEEDCIIGLILILLNIPLRMIQGVINDRDYSQSSVKKEISRTIAEAQTT